MTAKGFNKEGSAPWLREFLRIMARFGPVNMGDMKTGNIYKLPMEAIIEQVQDTSIVHAVFDSEEKMMAAVQAAKEADLGISVVVSGLMAEVATACRKSGIVGHTLEHSLGFRGKTREKLPPFEILEVASMCGHGMVSFNLVKKALIDVKLGNATPAEAAKTDPTVAGSGIRCY